jgi:hypothetical protein
MRAPPNVRLAPNPARTAPAQGDNQDRPHLLSNIDRLNQARDDLDRLTDQFAVLADWNDDFRKRRDRAQLKFELIGLDPLDDEALVAEANELKRCFRALSWLGRVA